MLRLGVIGLSPGNGHPYSWSAIFNGYEHAPMESCGFPVIPRYLEKQSFPKDQIAGARVTHVWAQERDRAKHIARATRIGIVVNHYEDMIGAVDAVLLARDDAQRHLEFALPFLKAGLPIYVDKPLALSLTDAWKMLRAQQYAGQLFTCSALRYAREFQLSDADCLALGEIRQIHATTPKDWDKYAVHVIEPALLLAKDRGSIVRTQKWCAYDSTTLAACYAHEFQLLVTAAGSSSAPLSLRVVGEKDWKDLHFRDSFSAFRSALREFVKGVRAREPRIHPDFTLEVIELIEAGRTP
jgi:predicted dehydrogenase